MQSLIQVIEIIDKTEKRNNDNYYYKQINTQKTMDQLIFIMRYNILEHGL